MTYKYGTKFIFIARHYKWEDCEIDAHRFDARPSRINSIPITLVGIPYLGVNLLWLLLRLVIVSHQRILALSNSSCRYSLTSAVADVVILSHLQLLMLMVNSLAHLC